ncbi:Uncharacterized protein Adt_38543 [Abeliophyllum distichum]|uniref:Uncharacterized protein n=1 Tax=Abeliophyllum distichum TaxID=126358 RepID=A0ABD1Q3H5_9LAMI
MTFEKKAIDPNASHTIEMVVNKRVETVEANIRKLNIQLDESRMIYAAMTDDAVANLPDPWKEMKAMRFQLQILQRVVGNGQALAQEYAPRLRILESRTYGGKRNAKEVENF